MKVLHYNNKNLFSFKFMQNKCKIFSMLEKQLYVVYFIKKNIPKINY